MNATIMFIPLVLTLVISGCAIHEGHERHLNPPTLGSELIELQKAHEQGALDDLEYRELRQELLAAGPDDARDRRWEKDAEKAWERGHED